LSFVNEKIADAPAVTLVPCADAGRAGCQIVRRAAELVGASTPAVVRVAEECPRGTRSYVVALDSSSACRASDTLLGCGCRASAIISAPEVLARSGLLKPGLDVRAHTEELAQALAAAIRDSLVAVFAEAEARQRYREEMAPVMSRFQGIWEKLAALPSPNGAAEPAEGQKVELLGRRARNLFVKFDELMPPAEWSEPHDLFQDALLCIAYATEGWAAGDETRWEQNLEKAKAQIAPLRRRLEG